MQPRNPLLDTYMKLSAEVVGRVDAALRSVAWVPEGGGPGRFRTARTAWTPVPDALEQISTAMTDLGEGIYSIVTDQRITDDTKSTDIAALADRTRTKTKILSAQILTACDTILTSLRLLAYPARPDGAGADQEAALAGLKSDLRMVWDAADGNDLNVAMSTSLDRAVGEGDALATWLLASTHWPEDYLTSRGMTADKDGWAPLVAQRLDTISPPELAKARAVYNSCANAQQGLPVLSQLLGQGVLGALVNDLAGWRPTTWDPTPPTPMRAANG